jgi:hypothetical protein
LEQLLAEDNNVTQTLSTNRADQSFYIRTLQARTRR